MILKTFTQDSLITPIHMLCTLVTLSAAHAPLANPNFLILLTCMVFFFFLIVENNISHIILKKRQNISCLLLYLMLFASCLLVLSDVLHLCNTRNNGFHRCHTR